jgi:hypothetical protein
MEILMFIYGPIVDNIGGGIRYNNEFYAFYESKDISNGANKDLRKEYLCHTRRQKEKRKA